MTTAGVVLAAARTAPVLDLHSLVGGRPVLVLAPHPDDESLGCAGLIAACVQRGIDVAVVLLTDGAASHPGSRTHPPARLARLRECEMQQALGELGLAPAALHALGWPDTAAPLDGPDFARAVDQLAAVALGIRAGTIVTAWGSDPHCDHAAAAAIAAAAASRLGLRLLAYPVWGWTLPADAPVAAGPAARLSIVAYLDAKRRAIACHRSQYGAVVQDTVGFSLPPALIAACTAAHEVFFRMDAGDAGLAA